MSVQIQKGVPPIAPPASTPPPAVSPKDFQAPVPKSQAPKTAAPAEKKEDKPAAKQAPSRVILLRNMVGKGQVDPELENEIKEECTKFGAVMKCKVHEDTSEGVTEADTIRIFVQFSTITAASKAVKVMNGRFFAGRSVKGCPYPEVKFNKDELNDPV